MLFIIYSTLLSIFTSFLLHATPTVITPNIGSLPYLIEDDGVKVFHLVAEPIHREFTKGFWVNC